MRAPGVALEQEGLLRLQAEAGNRAITALLSRHQAPRGSPPILLPRNRDVARLLAGASRGPALQRAIGEDFAVRGIFPDAGKPEHENKVYFDFAKHEIPDQEQPKLDTLAAPPDRDLVLHGFVSEEGGTAGNAPVANARIKAVSGALGDRGHLGRRDGVPHLTESEGVIDYRSKRYVEVLPLGTDASTTGCDTNPACETTFESAIDQAATNVLNAAIALSADSDDARAALQQAFHGTTDATKSEVLTGLSNILAQFDVMRAPTGHTCKGTCDEPSCTGGTVAFNRGRGAGAAAVMTLCPDFGRSPDIAPPDLLVHEAAHGATPLAADDHAHAEARLFKHLLPAATVKNADSYMLFTRLIATGERGPTPPEEQFGAGFTDDEKSEADKTVAWLGELLNKAGFSMRGLYGRIHRNRTEPATPGGEEINSEGNQELRRFMAPRFGMTAPPSRPSDRDQWKVAGLADRYDELSGNTSPVLTIDKGPVAGAVWEPGPGTTVTVGDAFLAAPLETRVRQLMLALITASPNITAERRQAFVDLVFKLQELNARDFSATEGTP